MDISNAIFAEHLNAKLNLASLLKTVLALAPAFSLENNISSCMKILMDYMVE